MTKRVLVTGVSSGIGLAQARLFLEKGYQVFGVDQGEKPALQGDFHFLQRDLTFDLEPILTGALESIFFVIRQVFWMTTSPY